MFQILMVIYCVVSAIVLLAGLISSFSLISAERWYRGLSIGNFVPAYMFAIIFVIVLAIIWPVIAVMLLVDRIIVGGDNED